MCHERATTCTDLMTSSSVTKWKFAKRTKYIIAVLLSMLYNNETNDFFDETLTYLRENLLMEVRSNRSVAIPKDFWDYVHQLERCLALHYKPPGGIRHKFHGGIEHWRDAIHDHDLPWYGAKFDS